MKLTALMLMFGWLAMAQDARKSDKPERMPTYTNSITLSSGYSEPLVSINTTTGKITYGKNYTPDAAAQEFWQAIAHKSPALLEARIKELEAEVAKCNSLAAQGEQHD